MRAASNWRENSGSSRGRSRAFCDGWHQSSTHSRGRPAFTSSPRHERGYLLTLNDPRYRSGSQPPVTPTAHFTTDIIERGGGGWGRRNDGRGDRRRATV